MSITLLRKRPISAVDGTGDQLVQQSQQQFLRKSARGKVTKVLREHYLRPDIPCGSLYCDACHDLYEITQAPTLASTGQEDLDTSVRSKKAKRANFYVLSRDGREPLSGDLASRHYLLLDTNIVLHQVWSPQSGSRFPLMRMSRWIYWKRQTLAQISSYYRLYWMKCDIAPCLCTTD